MASFVNELSSRNPWKLEKERFLELKHFCLQYESWRVKVFEMTYLPVINRMEVKGTEKKNIVEEKAMLLANLQHNLNIVRECVEQADPDLRDYILVGVTQNKSYEWLVTNMNMPASSFMYYDRYRKFFWLLDKVRN